MPFEDEKLASHNNLIFIVIASVEPRTRERRARRTQFTEVPGGSLRPPAKRKSERGEGEYNAVGPRDDGPEPSRVPALTNKADDKRANEHTVSHN